VVDGQPHGVEPDLPVRTQRRELPASLDPHLAVGVPRHRSAAPGLTRPPRRSARGRWPPRAGRPSRPPWQTRSCVDRGVRHQRAATTAVPELVPADVGLGVAVSLCRQVSPPPRLVLARALRGRGPARTSCDRSGPPLAAVWAHQVGRPRTAAKRLDDLLFLGRHLFTLPSCVRSPHAAPVGPRRSPRPPEASCRSACPRVEVLGVVHRILVLQRPRSFRHVPQDGSTRLMGSRPTTAGPPGRGDGGPRGRERRQPRRRSAGAWHGTSSRRCA
jgi:hypothetical protein